MGASDKYDLSGDLSSKKIKSTNDKLDGITGMNTVESVLRMTTLVKSMRKRGDELHEIHLLMQKNKDIGELVENLMNLSTIAQAMDDGDGQDLEVGATLIALTLQDYFGVDNLKKGKQ